jgi:hypothetical protein
VRILVAALVSLVGVGTGAGVAHGQPLKPFTHVDNVCPRCTTGPAYDTVSLRAGGDVRAFVVAENDAFLVLERLGELRAVGRDQVVGVRHEPSPARPTGYPDQILLVDGTVLAGTMAADPAADTSTFEITVPRTPTALHRIDHSVVAAVYRGGKRVYAATGSAAPTSR